MSRPYSSDDFRKIIDVEVKLSIVRGKRIYLAEGGYGNVKKAGLMKNLIPFF